LRPDVLAKMIANKARVGILAKSEVTTDLPEFRFLKADTTANWDELRGLGAEIETPLNSCAEENILCYGEGIDPYYLEDIVIHEFAHTVHGLGISFVDTNFDTELREAFENAKAKDLWKNTYAGSNQEEYFAEGVQDWFNLNAESIPGDGIHNEINTRDELQKYDPTLYAIIKRYFPSEYGKISCHQASTAEQDIPYTIAQRYFVNNTYNEGDLVNPKITTREQFRKIFGMATVMGENGKPTVIDFSRQYVLSVIGELTDRKTEISLISLKQNANRILLNYKITEGERESVTIRPVLLLIVDNKYQGEVELFKQ